MGKKPGRTLALRWYEDALALASYVEAQGFSEDALRVREFAAKVHPDRVAEPTVGVRARSA